jgi:hypothetical protein
MNAMECFIHAHLDAQQQLLKYFAGDVDENDEVELARCVFQSQVSVHKAVLATVDIHKELQSDPGLVDELHNTVKRKHIVEELEKFVEKAQKLGAISEKSAGSLLHPLHHEIHACIVFLEKKRDGYIHAEIEHVHGDHHHHGEHHQDIDHKHEAKVHLVKEQAIAAQDVAVIPQEDSSKNRQVPGSDAATKEKASSDEFAITVGKAESSMATEDSSAEANSADAPKKKRFKKKVRAKDTSNESKLDLTLREAGDDPYEISPGGHTRETTPS